MNERDLSWRILLVGGLLAVGWVSVWPLDERIKFGIDLRGGYSLTYEIDDSGMESDPNKAKLAEDVMKILKERVDPNGVLNLVWRPIGHNRLEIQMPRPPAEVVKKRDEYIAARDALMNLSLRRGDVILALSRRGPEREAAFAKIVGGVPRRRELLDALAKAHDAQAVAEDGNDPAAMDAAAKSYADALKAVLATNVEMGRLESAINIDARKPQRQTQIEQIKKEHAELRPQIEAVVAAFDAWRAQRGKGEGSLDDPADLQRLLRGAGVLEFRLLVPPDPSDATIQQYVENLQKRGTRRTAEDRYGWFQIENPEYFFKMKSASELEKQFDTLKRGYWVAERFGDKYYLLGHLDPSKTLAQDRGGVNEWKLKSSYPTRDESGRPAVSFELDEAGGSRFQRLTSANVGKQLCFFLDGMAVSAANINSAIRTRGIIQGSFTQDEVQRLCQKLNAGSLPRKLKEPPISIQGVGPSLGEANRTAGQRAAMFGCLAVFAFMFIYYRYAGVVAIIALVLNILLTGAVTSALNATMTLAGIAGLVLAIGMAVDANVLINERIREELARGVTMRQAIKLGYDKAFSAILDSNVTTILTSLILYWLGSEEIKGFALTLGWGVIISLGTAVYVTRYFFEYMDAPKIPKSVHMRPLLIALGAAAFGGLLWGADYLRLPPELHRQSGLMFLGRLFIYVLPATLLVQLLMIGMRSLHCAQQVRKSNSLPMMALIGVPRVNWFNMRHAFFAVSLIASVGGMLVFFSRDSRGVYDIEFLGGTSVQIDLKPEAAATATQEVIEEKLKSAKADMEGIAAKVESADVKQAGAEYIVTAAGVPSDRLKNIVTARLRDNLPQGGVTESGDHAVRIRLKDGAKLNGQDPTVELMKVELAAAAARAREAGADIADSQVQSVATAGQARSSIYEIVTRETSRELVVDAILSQLKNDLDIQPSLDFKLREDATRGGATFFPITSEDLGRVIGETTSTEHVPEWVGGVAIVVDDLQPPQTIASLKKRLRDMRLQPSNAAIGWRQQQVVGLTQAGESAGQPLYSRVALLTTDENYIYEEGGSYVAQWREDFAGPEVKLAREALERQTSLGKVSQFAPQVASEAKTRAYFAVALSWIMIIAYLWFRFGNWVWGLSAVIALIHDVTMALGLVAVSYYLYKIPGMHQLLLIEPLRIDMAIIAAILTVIGYSVNDKIVIFDRIRENRGKGRDITPAMVNDSINQCMSRTFLTGGALIANIIIMYIWGGRGIHGFNFAMLIGCVVGTYSSFAIASPLLVLLRKRAGEPVPA